MRFEQATGSDRTDGGVAIAAAFAPHAERIALTAARGVRVVGIDEVQVVWQQADHDRHLNAHAVAWSHDGRLIAAISGDELSVIEAATGRRVADQRDCGAAGVAFGPDDTRVITANGEYAVADLVQLVRHSPSRFAARGQFVARVFDRQLTIIDLTTHDVIGEFPLRPTDRVFGLAIAPEAKVVAVAGLTTVVWDVATQRPVLEHVGLAYAVDFSPDGSLLAVARAHDLGLINAESGEVLFEDPSVAPNQLSFSPGGTRLCACDSRGAHLWELSSDDGGVR